MRTTLTALALVLALGCSSEEPRAQTQPEPKPRPTPPPASSDEGRIVIKGAKSEKTDDKGPSPEDQVRIAQLEASAHASQGKHESGEPVKFARIPNAGPNGRRVSWTESANEAATSARNDHKLVLAAFLSSDSSADAKKLKSEVFDTVDFQEWANTNAVLLLVDFPKEKPQSDELKAQNRNLADQLKIQVTQPTVVFIDPEGKVVDAIVGYSSGAGVKAWLKAAQSIVDRYR
jgi:hypothetical protein